MTRLNSASEDCFVHERQVCALGEKNVYTNAFLEWPSFCEFFRVIFGRRQSAYFAVMHHLYFNLLNKVAKLVDNIHSR